MTSAHQLESKAHAQLVTNNDNETTILSATKETNASCARTEEMSLQTFSFLFFFQLWVI
jgi:hypothetical protein